MQKRKRRRNGRAVPRLTAFLGAFSVLFAAGARAQTDIVLVSTLGQVSQQVANSIGSDSRLATKFTVEPDNDYTLTSVTVNRSTGGSHIDVAIHEADTGNTNNPASTALYSLERPSSTSSGNRTFTAASGATLTLTKGTSYFVVVSTSASSQQSFILTNSNDEDANGVTGFTVANSGRRHNGSSWSSTGTLRMNLRGNVRIEESTAPMAVGGSARAGAISPSGDVDRYEVPWVENTDAYDGRYRVDVDVSAAAGLAVADVGVRVLYVDYPGGDSRNRVYRTEKDTTTTTNVASFFFYPEVNGSVWVEVFSEGGNTGSYTVSVGVDATEPADDQEEPDEPHWYRLLQLGDPLLDRGVPRTIAAGASATGEIESPGDGDWFEVALTANMAYTAALDVDGAWSTRIALFGLFDAEGIRVAEADKHGSGSGTGDGEYGDHLEYTPAVTGTHYLLVGSAGADTGDYTLSVADGTPAGDDYTVNAPGTGWVAVGGSSEGEIERSHDADGFGAFLHQGIEYRIDFEGADTSMGTLADPAIRNIAHPEGWRVQRNGVVLADDNSGSDDNARLDFTPGLTGTYTIRVAGSSGGTGTYTLSLGQLDDYAAGVHTAGVAPVNGRVSGEVERAGDRDWFRVDFPGRGDHRIHVLGSPTSDGTLADPKLFGVYDAGGELVPRNGNDNGGSGRNARKDFEVLEAGTFYLEVGASGSGTGTYAVAVEDLRNDEQGATAATSGHVPVNGSARGIVNWGNDRDWFRVSLEKDIAYRISVKGSPTDDGTLADPKLHGIHGADETLITDPVTVDDNDGDGNNAELEFTPAAEGDYYLAAGASGTGTGSYRVSVVQLEYDDYAATVDTRAVMESGGSVTGEIETANDRDWIRVRLPARSEDTDYHIDLEGAETGRGTLSDPKIWKVYNNFGTAVASTEADDGGVGKNSRLVFDQTVGFATYIYVEVGAARVGAGTYRLSVAPDDYAADTATTGVAELSTGDTDRTTLSATVDFPYDRDWFKATLVSGRVYRINSGVELGSAAGSETLSDPRVWGVYDADGAFIPGTVSEGTDSDLLFTPETAGTYFIAIGAVGAGTGSYELEVTRGTSGVDDCTKDSDTECTVVVDGDAGEGKIDTATDLDWWAVEVTKNQIYQIEMKGADSGVGTLVDPDISGILSGSTQTVAKGSSGGGDGFEVKLLFRAPGTTTYYIVARTDTENPGTGTYTLEVTDITDDATDDCAADTSTACIVTVGDSATGELELSDDHDWFQVQLESGKTYRFHQQGADGGGGTLVYPELFGLYDSGSNRIAGTFGTSLTYDDDLSPYFEHTPTTGGTFYVAAGGNNINSTDIGTYTVTVTDVTSKSITGPPGKPAKSLTAGFESAPSAHDGSTAFTVELVFSEVLAPRSRRRLLSSLEVAGATLVDVRAAAQGVRDRWRVELDPASHGPVTVSLDAGGDCASAPCTKDGRALSEEASTTIEGPPPASPLTGDFTGVPSEHDGSSAFTLRVSFNAELAAGGATGRLRRALSAGGATVTRVRRAAPPARDRFEVRLEPSGSGPVTVSLAAQTGCEGADALCTPDGRALSNAPDASVAGPPGLSVADAQVDEGPDARLAFAVTLDRAASRTVTVQAATSDGTALAGEDYRAKTVTKTFAPGETRKVVVVRVLDDSHDEQSETLTLALSSPSGAYLADGEATGTINNRDPLPRALLARFGRTAAVHVVEQVEERLNAPREPGFEGRFAGRELRGGMERELARELLGRLGGAAGLGGPGGGFGVAGASGAAGFGGAGRGGLGLAAGGAPPGGAAGSMSLGGGMGGAAGSLALGGSPGGPAAGSPGLGGSLGGPVAGAPGLAGSPGGAAGSMAMAGGMGGPGAGAPGLAAGSTGALSGPAGGPLGRGLHSLGLGGGNVLTGSAFALNRETGRGGILSFWSRGARSSFSGREGTLGLNGDVRTTMFGADYATGPLVVGLSLAHSRGLGGYSGVASGQVASSVTGLYPWLGYRVTDRVSVWGVTGYGRGGMLLSPAGGTPLETGLSMAMAAAGARGELVAGGADGFGLAFKADVLRVGTASEGVDGPGGRLAATAASVSRVRTALEGSRGLVLRGRLSLRPSVEVGLRHDAGDAETGAGLDLGAGLVVSDASTGLAVDLRVRTLLVHEDAGFRERGVALSVSYDPTPSTPLGFNARVAPSWGGQAASGAEALWGRDTMAGMAHGAVAQGSRMDAEVGYGLPVGSRFVGTPRVGFGASDYGRDYRLGYGLGVLHGERLNLELGVDARRRESPLAGGASNGVLGRVSLGW